MTWNIAGPYKTSPNRPPMMVMTAVTASSTGKPTTRAGAIAQLASSLTLEYLVPVVKETALLPSVAASR